MLQLRSNIFDTSHSGAPATLRLLRPGALDSRDEAAWDDLGGEALTPSVFAEPWFMRCSLAHCATGQAVRLAVVEDADRRWLGALPVVPMMRQGRSPVPAWVGWRHPNQFVGSPLVRRGQANRFWRGLVDGLAVRGRRVSLVLGGLPVDDPVTEALFCLTGEQDRTIVTDRRVLRACLSSAVAPAPCAKQRSRIRGLERKLAGEVGPVKFELVREPAAIERLIDGFLVLEQSGWKGRAGSALASAERTRAFFGAVCRAAAAQGRLEIATLSAGDRLVALSTQIEGAGWVYGFKATYDEAFARCAPGLLLLDRLTGAYVERGDLKVDSCAVPDQQPVSRLWPERRALVDCRVALGGAIRGWLFAAMLACERAVRGMRAGG